MTSTNMFKNASNHEHEFVKPQPVLGLRMSIMAVKNAIHFHQIMYAKTK